ncbi:MAG: hypothetical protein R3330_12380, partial [Saprospiraceae bacterium]|nr:hypothetical protein [Saprospiraceae bacterium]
PVIVECPVKIDLEGCSTADMPGPAFSTVVAVSSEAEFEDATNQGDVTDACGVTSVTYIDVANGTCPIVVTRTWTVSDACGNTATCEQEITIADDNGPLIASCAVVRNIEGCSTADITGPAFSTVSAASSEAEFEDATNQGDVSDGCSIASVTYVDVTAGTCPIVVTRTWTITDQCGNTSTCNQIINVNDTTDPVIAACAVTRNIDGCSTADITGPAFSTVSAPSSEAEFENATNQGDVTDGCGIAAVSYIDVAGGTCPLVVTRTWTITDLCGNTSTCDQTINVNDSTDPVITSCPVTRSIEGCTTADITGPAFSTVTAVSSEAEFENATNQGNTSDDCGIASVTYIDVAGGACPIVVTRTWTITDLCGNTTTCDQTININDTTDPAISACAVARNIDGCTTADITGPAFSAVSAPSSEAEFEDATNQGNVSDGCGIASVTYSDVANGTCPIIVTRTWTITDQCGNTATCDQVISVNDGTGPAITNCAVTRNIEGCSTTDITGPSFSAVSAP